MQSYETFPPGSSERWKSLIEKELGTPVREGLPLPFYTMEELPSWKSLSPLPTPTGWKLIAERYVPDEIDIWLFDARFEAEGARAKEWLLVGDNLPTAYPPGTTLYQLWQEETPSPIMGNRVWELPFFLTSDLRVEGQWPAIPSEGELHLAIRLDQRVLISVLLMRALRLALWPRPTFLWALPASTLYDSTGSLSQEGPEENLIRATLYALGAILGGAHAVYIPPIHSAEDSHAARWSRNISHLLRHEVAHLYSTADPLAGSFYIETESRRLAAHLQTLLP
ncbi:MAG: methylmalonyl-CoA mutase family protein [Bacteroidia bacterium]|nr:methylmalonyl-CoA mutase family protein [Bacteroidia bacterium]